MKRTIAGIILAGALAAAIPAAAQTSQKPTPAPDTAKPVSFSIGGGISAPVGGAADALGVGGQFTLGLTFPVAPKVSLTGEYGYASLGTQSLTVPQAASETSVRVDGNGWYQYVGGTANYTAWSSGNSSVYLRGGFGWYHRAVYVTTPATGQIAVCEPNWFVCYPTAVAVETVVTSRGTNNPGINVGGGVTWRMSHLASLFAEVRFHHVWGPDEPTASGGTKAASAQFFPITVGLKF
jgi:hypothetical protein